MSSARAKISSMAAQKKVMDFKVESVEKYYEIGPEIGSGKFAKVKNCKDRSTGIEYAGKFIQKKRCKSSKRGVTVSDIQREVSILEELNHENIVKLFDVYETMHDVVLMLELVSGGELFHYLADKDKVSEDEAVIFLKQILQGVQHIHDRDIIHLDIKPENIVLDGEGKKKVKIIDFGLSLKLLPNVECRSMTGTPEFVAPEVINYDPLSTAVDMWSIGVLTYIMLSGCSPFLGDDPQETMSNATSAIYSFDEEYFSKTSELAKDFINKLLVKHPNYSDLGCIVIRMLIHQTQSADDRFASSTEIFALLGRMSLAVQVGRNSWDWG